METKEQLIKLIKDWVKIDNEIRVLQKEQLTRKTEKIDISKKLMEVMQKNDIDWVKSNKRKYKKKILKLMIILLKKFFEKKIENKKNRK